MDKLKLIVQNKQRQKDVSWQNLYNSDLRSLFPKYQLSKIQKAKIKYDKFRLMMDNLEDFLHLEAHRREKKMQADQIDDIKSQLQQLNTNDNNYHYKFSIIQRRDNIDNMCKQITNYGSEYNANPKQPIHKNKQLHQIIQNNQKWRNYIQNNCKKLEQVTKQHNFVERAQLAETVYIPNTYQSLNQSTSSQILLNRLKREQFNRKLLEKWINNQQNQEEGAGAVNIERSFVQEWKSKIKDIDFKQFV